MSARALLVLALVALPRVAAAWPAPLMDALARDARRLLPRSLARLVYEREREIAAESRAFPPELAGALAHDLGGGRVDPATLALLDARAAEASALLREGRVGEGVVRLGALLRIPADLSDPVLSVGPEGFPAGVTREYYAFVEASLDKIPVVIDEPAALELSRPHLPGYWQKLLGRSRGQSAVIVEEMYRGGRVVSHRALDYRSPVFGVASLSYSRAVTAIAATWLAVWRDARGDLTGRPAPIILRPGAPPGREKGYR